MKILNVYFFSFLLLSINIFAKDSKINFSDRVVKIKEVGKKTIVYFEIGPSICYLNKKNKNYTKLLKILKRLKQKNLSAKFSIEIKNHEILKILPEK